MDAKSTNREIATDEVAESFERLRTHRAVAASVFSDPNMTPHDMLRGAMAFQLAVLEQPAALGMQPCGTPRRTGGDPHGLREHVVMSPASSAPLRGPDDHWPMSPSTPHFARPRVRHIIFALRLLAMPPMMA